MNRDQQSSEARTANSPTRPTGSGVLILLCTYNEIGNLPKVVAAISDLLPDADILVVDDKSPDGTGEWAEEQSRTNSRLFTIRRRGKLGLGSATRAGLMWGLARAYDFILNLDADLSHNPLDAPKLLAACRCIEPPVDVIVGPRYVVGGGVVGLSCPRKFASKLLNRYATRLLRLPIHDCSGSYRCYRASKLRELDFERLRCNGYGFLEEILCHLHRRGAAIAELPIVFEHRFSGTSKLRLRDAIGAIAVIHRLAIP